MRYDLSQHRAQQSLSLHQKSRYMAQATTLHPTNANILDEDQKEETKISNSLLSNLAKKLLSPP